MQSTTAPPVAAWRPTAAGLLAATVALGAALLVPRAFSDPVGVDPFQVRLAAASLALLGAAALSTRLLLARPMLLATASIAAPFCLWAAMPRGLAVVAGDRFSGNQQILAADIAYLVATLGFVALARWWLSPEARPRIRLGGVSLLAAAVAVGGSLLLLGIAMALPAPLLGREGIQPISLARDLPLVGPAFALQAAAQEAQFRGLLLGALETGLAPWTANLAQATFFGLAHVAVQYEGPAGPFVPLTIALGLLLGWVTQWTRSLWPAIVIHAVLEVAVAVAILNGLYGY